jgi:PTS system nitrogen regulatory IIA component
MDLSVREVARLLDVTEDTVYRWVKAGTLPAYRVGENYRFNRVELQEWAVAHHHRVAPELIATRALPSLVAAIERGGVYYKVPGARREDVLDAIAKLPGIPDGVDRNMLYELLVAREQLAPTGLGDGIAIPHPRDPLVVRLDEPRVLLGFLGQAVDFHAVDGQPVRVVFVVLSPTVKRHLEILARLAYALHDPTFKELLRITAPQDALIERLRAIESASPQTP